jgi:RNA polymerase sporulation-specific sigma factor
MERKLNDEQKKLIENNLGLVYYVVNNFFSKNFYYIPKEELIAQGYLIMSRSTLNYDYNKGEYSSYIFICLKNELLKYVLKYFNTRIETVEIREDLIKESYVDNYNFNKTDDVRTFLSFYLEEKMVNIIIDYYYNNLTWEEVSKKYGYVDRKSVCAVVQQKLRSLTKNEYTSKKIREYFSQ